MNQTRDKILGSIWGAALGDAMGAATECRSAERIKEDFGGYVETLIAPPKDTFAHDCPAGSVTDDFSLAYFVAQEASRSGGKIDTELSKRALLTWAEYPEFVKFAGPSTRLAIARMKGVVEPDRFDYLVCNNLGATNGSGMKVFSIGLINPGNCKKAVDDAVQLCLPTHPNQVSISGACAIAAAVSAAMTASATLDSVLAAGVQGAHTGFELGGKVAARLAVPSIEKRIPLAVEIGKRGLGWEQTMLELRDIIGAGLLATESIPCVFGILAANPNDAFGAIKMGVNIGDDTDTVATMVGAIAGALYGTSNIPTEMIQLIEKTNRFDFDKLTDDIVKAFY